jgi:hypothetical protein
MVYSLQYGDDLVSRTVKIGNCPLTTPGEENNNYMKR